MHSTTTNAPALPGLETPDAAPDSVSRPRERRRAAVALPLLVLLVASVAGTNHWLGLGRETTDDAHIEGHVASVSARIVGHVEQVLVKENQAVSKGDLLVVLDRRERSVRVAVARADLRAAEARLAAATTELAVTRARTESNLLIARGGMERAHAVAGTTRATIEHARAALMAAEARVGLARLEYDRSVQLAETGALARAELDARRAALQESEAAQRQAQAMYESAEANRANSTGTVETARGQLLAAESGPAELRTAEARLDLERARVEQARAAVEEAELALSYTEVRADLDGVIARRSVEVGQFAAPERPLMAIVALDDTWVVANFKEDQIAEMRPGQAARLHVDTYDRELAAHVESLAPGTGSRFSLLPPDNASGNFVKVVQRVPVSLRLEPHPGLVLRPGMSVTATVYVEGAP